MIPKFTGPITRRNYGRGHGYKDANGHKVPGVTTILGKVMAKGALVGWSARMAADVVVNEWETLEGMKPTDRHEYVRNAHARKRNAKAVRGTNLHSLAVPLSEGKTVDVPEDLTELVESYVQFLDDGRVTPVFSEFSVYSLSLGYGGTGDVICDIWNHEAEQYERWLLDIKQSSGVYAEAVLQLTGYRYAERMILADGTDVPMPPVARTGILHVRQDGYSLIPIITEAPAFEYWTSARNMYEFVKDDGDGQAFILEEIPLHSTHDEENDNAKATS